MNSIDNQTAQFIVMAILTIITIISPFALYFWKQHQTKELIYEITANAPVFQISDEFKGSLEVSYNHIPVQDLRLILIKFANAGNIPILSRDFERPVNLYFPGEKTKLLSHDIVEKTPKDLDIQLQVENNVITILPTLLNQQDDFTVKVLLSDFHGKVTVGGRIAGVKRIRALAADETTKMPQVFRLIGRVVLDITGKYNASDTTASIIGIVTVVLVISIGLGFGSSVINRTFLEVWKLFFSIK